MTTEWAVLVNNEIVNVVTTGRGRECVMELAAEMSPAAKVTPLDSVPLEIKQRYRYWDGRP